MISVPKSDLEMIFNMLGAKLSDSSGSSSVKLNKSGKPKKQNANKGKPTCHGDFVKMLCETHKAEVDAFKAANPGQKGAHLVFAANYKKEHKEETLAFETKWKEEHPKDAASETASTSGSDAASADGSAKPKRVMSDEQKAKMKAGREAAAAKKAAEKAGVAAPVVAEPVAAPVPVVAEPVVAPVVAEPVAAPVAKKAPKTVKKAAITTPVVAPVATETAAELLPFTFNGATYLRMGSKLPNGEALYTSGHLWMSKKGAKGPHYGELKDDGSIDMEAEEPTA